MTPLSLTQSASVSFDYDDEVGCRKLQQLVQESSVSVADQGINLVLSCAFPGLQLVVLPDAFKDSWPALGLCHTGTEPSSLGKRGRWNGFLSVVLESGLS